MEKQLQVWAHIYIIVILNRSCLKQRAILACDRERHRQKLSCRSLNRTKKMLDQNGLKYTTFYIEKNNVATA